MLIKIHCETRNEINHPRDILVVTSDATHCRARIDESGRVTSFSGDIWPGDLPSVFYKGKPAYGQTPTFLFADMLVHFIESTASLERTSMVDGPKAC